MFTNPGSRPRSGGDGQEKFKNSITVGANVSINTSSLVLGNSVANIVSSTLSVQVANSTANTLVTPASVNVSSSTANTQIGPGTVVLQGTGSNTGLTFGTQSLANVAAGPLVTKGYCWLPNGLMLQWLPAQSNSAGIVTTFPVTFGTNAIVWSVSPATSTLVGANTSPRVTAINSSSLTLTHPSTTLGNTVVMVFGH